MPDISRISSAAQNNWTLKPNAPLTSDQPPAATQALKLTMASDAKLSTGVGADTTLPVQKQQVTVPTNDILMQTAKQVADALADVEAGFEEKAKTAGVMSDTANWLASTVGATQEDNSWLGKGLRFVGLNKSTTKEATRDKLNQAKTLAAQIDQAAKQGDAAQVRRLYQQIVDLKLVDQISTYTNNQGTARDALSSIGSGLAAAAIWTVAAAAAIPTGGLSLAAVGGAFIAGSYTVGGAVLTKTVLNGSDALIAGRSYTREQLTRDVLSGGIDGILAPIAPGVGNFTKTRVAKLIGVTLADGAIDATAKTALGKFIQITTVNGTELIITGGIQGAGSSVANAAILNGERDPGELTRTAGQGFVVGGAVNTVVGGASRVMGPRRPGTSSAETPPPVTPETPPQYAPSKGHVGDASPHQADPPPTSPANQPSGDTSASPAEVTTPPANSTLGDNATPPANQTPSADITTSSVSDPTLVDTTSNAQPTIKPTSTNDTQPAATKKESSTKASDSSQLLGRVVRINLTPGQKEAQQVIAENANYAKKIYTANGISTDSLAEAVQKARIITAGDLHASTPKLVETLHETGLATFANKADAERFIQLYQQYENTLRKFKAKSYQLSDAEIAQGRHEQAELIKLLDNLEWTGGNRKLRLIGDTIFDRGADDTLILHIGNKFKDHIEVLASNHDYDALNLISGSSRKIDERYPHQFLSLFPAQRLSSNRRLLTQQYQQYLKNQKLMAYSPENGLLYLHAPVANTTEARFFDYLLKATQDAGLFTDNAITPTNLEAFVDASNRLYQQHVADKLAGKATAELDGFFSDFVWHRSALVDEAELPLKNSGVKGLVHGHDSDSKTSPFSIERGSQGGYRVFNLDQRVRKGIDSTSETDQHVVFVE